MARPAALPYAFCLVAMEGPDPYSHVGGLAVRVSGLAEALAAAGFPTTLVFQGDPDRPPVERHGRLTLRRVAQDVARRYPAGVYEGEEVKRLHLEARLPEWLRDEVVAPALHQGQLPVVAFEDWQTAGWARRLSDVLHAAGTRARTLILWNANHEYGAERIDWTALRYVAAITTVSRFMRHRLARFGVDPVVIPNGIPTASLRPVPAVAVAAVRRATGTRPLLVKMGRFTPDKRWLQAVRALARLRADGHSHRLLIRGGREPHGAEVLAAARALGLRVVPWTDPIPDGHALAAALRATAAADVLDCQAFLPVPLLPVLHAAAAATLANSGYEPFGLVGLETMAAGGVAVVGATGEDYARHLHNSLVIETDDPAELALAITALDGDPALRRRLRAAARTTARAYAWPVVLTGDLLPRLPVLAARQAVEWPRAVGA
ncbi:MAG TPA: glycosyltransferase [Candidatus Dormibacteraeota bacterium]|nr:glycosyltransferase [Candidatus Dormibacteraeota bacterium]